MTIDDRLHCISTLVSTQEPDGAGQGSGFFYHRNGPKDPNKTEQWVSIQETWLVTNRHVAFPAERLPSSLTFYLRKINGKALRWEPITLNQQELRDRMVLSTDADVDVCLIRVLDLITEKIKSGDQYAQWGSVCVDDFPGQQKIQPHAGSDVLIVGYPRGYYDETNLFPIVKAGIVASRWGLPFNGQPYFLVDAKLFPGTSGSIVISKPVDIVIEDGKVFHAKEKVYAFLGVFSGEPAEISNPVEFEEFAIIRRSGFNVGIVWYGQVLEEIILSGVKPD